MEEKKAGRGILVTTSWFTAGGRQKAHEHGRMQLVDGQNLIFLIEKYVGKHVVISVKRPRNAASIDQPDLPEGQDSALTKSSSPLPRRQPPIRVGLRFGHIISPPNAIFVRVQGGSVRTCSAWRGKSEVVHRYQVDPDQGRLDRPSIVITDDDHLVGPQSGRDHGRIAISIVIGEFRDHIEQPPIRLDASEQVVLPRVQPLRLAGSAKRGTVQTGRIGEAGHGALGFGAQRRVLRVGRLRPGPDRVQFAEGRHGHLLPPARSTLQTQHRKGYIGNPTA
ncbi:hypothetical protein Vau01_121400 [Virgisporangium aurantiacum]|uniref:Restriction endonuclease type IV Mrr domain-containing protein n=2 Tax=Virgisporangium aurantiacum TaxID=175570 RepID=A0A8J3ZI36_9ACTN|nr:hypothetical protein Vau01_121400 [Virgisporangium aurantiacum]